MCFSPLVCKEARVSAWVRRNSWRSSQKGFWFTSKEGKQTLFCPNGKVLNFLGVHKHIVLYNYSFFSLPAFLLPCPRSCYHTMPACIEAPQGQSGLFKDSFLLEQAVKPSSFSISFGMKDKAVIWLKFEG